MKGGAGLSTIATLLGAARTRDRTDDAEGRPSVETDSYTGFQAPRLAGFGVLFAEAQFPRA